MASKVEPHPYNLPNKPSLISRVYRPSVSGSLAAAVAVLGPSPPSPAILRETWGSLTARLLPDGSLPARVVAVIPRRLYVIVAAFSCGFLTFHCVEWARYRTVKALLEYRGWVYNPKSLVTKLWGVVLNVLIAIGGERTYGLQSVLPKQPLPDLDMTLDRWLRASRQFVSKEDFEQTKAAVESFRDNEGPKLQTYLRNKANKTTSWLADYWLTAAYLAGRAPIAVNNNYYITTGFPLGEKKPDALSRASTWIHNFGCFEEMVVKQQVPPFRIVNTVPMCMNGYNYVCGTVREPGEHMDTILKYNDRHIIVIRNGHFFKLDLYYKTPGSRRATLLSKTEIRRQLERICDTAKGFPDVPSVAALTAQNRSTWAKQRVRLQEKNKQVLHDVESSMFVFCIDDFIPKDVSDFCKTVLSGNGSGNDRWFDKCFNGVSFGDAMTGMNVEHSVLDATVFGTVCEYSALHEDYVDGQLVSDPTRPDRTLPEPEHLEWDLTGLEDDIKVATEICRQMNDNLDLCLYVATYGKGVMKQKRVSPDGYIQMMFHLAYYRMYNEIPKTYEPSTGRLFLLGRTETVHPGSPHSVAWVRAMDDPSATKQTRGELFRKAVRYQSQQRLEATIGQGCDRHLFGLMCAARELGMDLPSIFIDKAWRAPFVLSTSQTPTRAYEYGTPVNFDCASGGFGPGAQEGYGISYIIMGDDRINMAITSWKTAEDINSAKFAAAIDQAMRDTKEMLS